MAYVAHRFPSQGVRGNTRIYLQLYKRRRASQHVTALDTDVKVRYMAGREGSPSAPMLSAHMRGSSSTELASTTDRDLGLEASFSVTCGGSKAHVRVDSDGAFRYSPGKADAREACSPCQLWAQPALDLAGVDIVGATLEGRDSFRVWYTKTSNPTAGQRHRSLHKSAPMVCEAAEEATSAVTLLQKLNSWWGMSQPPRLVVFINPVSGQGKSQSVWNNHCQPVLDAAGIKVRIIRTERSKHAEEMTRSLDLASLDALVCVGGDGTMSEIVQGLFQRPDWALAVKLPLCMVPGGTGNGMAASSGLWTPLTATHALCKGCVRAMDVVSVLQPPGRRYYSFLSLTFGLFANIDIGTEYLRCLGSARNQVGAVVEIMRMTDHIAHIAVLPTSAAASLRTTGAAGVIDGKEGPATPLLDALGPLDRVDPLQEASLPQGWHTLGKDPFSLFVVSVMPWLALDFTLMPDERIDSGEMTLATLPGNLSRLEGLQVLLKADAGKAAEIAKMRVEKIAAIIMEPKGSGTWLVMDGEVLPFERIYAEVHPGLCSVIVAP